MQASTTLSSLARGSIVLMAASAAWAGPLQASSGSASDEVTSGTSSSAQVASSDSRQSERRGDDEAITSARLEGLTVVTTEGEEVGEITRVMDKAGQEIVRIQLDEGFLGIGEQELTVPVEDLSLTFDGQVRTRLTRDELKAMSEPQNRVGGQGDDIQQ